MKKYQIGAAIAVAAVTVTGMASTTLAKDSTKIKADGFVGVPQNQTGAAGNFAGFNGGGLPWGIGEAEVEVKRSGKVEVEFEGLIFTAGPNTGRNTVAQMRVGVSCLSLATGARTPVLSDLFDVTTAAAPALGGGDAEAETRIDLPAECAAPIVFITSPGGGWFAVNAL